MYKKKKTKKMNLDNLMKDKGVSDLTRGLNLGKGLNNGRLILGKKTNVPNIGKGNNLEKLGPKEIRAKGSSVVVDSKNT